MKIKRIFCAILALTMVFGVLILAGCGNDGAGETTTAPSGGDGTEPDGTTTVGTEDPEMPDYGELVLNAESLAKYKVVRVDETTEEEIAISVDLSKKIGEMIGGEIRIGNDFLIPGETPSEFEILVGNTNRERAAEVYKDLKYNDYVVTRDATRIIIAGGSLESLSLACEYFVSCFENGSFTVPGDFYYECRSTYSMPELKIEGVPVTDYQIVYHGAQNYVAAKAVRDAIGSAAGVMIPIVEQTAAQTEYEIVVGSTTRDKTKVETFYSYETEIKGKSIYLRGYDKYALRYAAYDLGETIKASNGNPSLESLKVSYTLPDREEYIKDIDKLYMRWQAEYTPDPRMLDYNGKLDAFTNVSSRVLTCAHRAECNYYPENSIESIISFYKMGGDVVELDIQATKDGVLILMHDDTLSRMTNASDFMGLVIDGIEFPSESDSVSDWTYEQICYLSLKDGAGGKNVTAVTKFKVPTLVEALEVCKGRLLIIPDKTNKWTYLPDNSGRANLYDAMVEANNFESIILSYGLNAQSGVEVQKYIKEKSGVTPLVLIRDNRDPLENVYKYLAENAIPGSFGVQVEGRYQADVFPERFKATYEALAGKVMMWGWTIVDKSWYPDSLDCADTWDKMYGVGYRMIMSNKYLDLVKYARETCNFD